jgi:hypothetical protein
MFTLAQEIFGDVLPADAIADIEQEERGPARADKAIEVFCQFRNPSPELRDRIHGAFVQEADLYARRNQDAFWELADSADEE